jgi:hypothetical protein
MPPNDEKTLPVCPFLKAVANGFKVVCMTDRCAWWVEEAKICAVLGIAKELAS